MRSPACLLALLLPGASAQQYGTLQAEAHPAFDISICDKASGCTSQSQSVVIDANWRWLDHEDGNGEMGSNCYLGNAWNDTFCPDSESGGLTCAQNCNLEGADEEYVNTYSVTAKDDALTLGFVTPVSDNGTNVGSRTYLMNGTDSYYMFKLKNREFTFDVNVSNLPCGVNGALYFVEMNEWGDYGKGANTAGARYGTGYCDAQCPHDVKFIEGEANNWEWNASDENSGIGHYGTCCAEMDIWEANSISQATTTHPCTEEGLYKCEGTDCGDNGPERYEGVCDKDGCDLAPYRSGNTNFFGAGARFDVDSTKLMTVVTQFITEDGTDAGDLVEIKRIFVQDGKVIETPDATYGGKTYNSISDEMCAAQKEVFEETNDNFAKGGMKTMGEALDRGMVLVMSLWDDHYAHMLWLDSTYPTNSTLPSDARGSCATDSGDPDIIEVENADASVTFSNVKIGEIGSTFDGGSGNICDADTTTCNVCGDCCKSYLADQDDCDACVTSECSTISRS
jgi:cellulose 1,4-beta-cellobiosidase